MQTHEEVDAIVSIDDRVFYKLRIIKNSENIKYVFGSSLTLTAKKGTAGIKISYENSDDVRAISTDLDFMLTYIDKGYFEINGQRIPFECENVDYSKFNIGEQRKILDFVKKVTEVLDVLGCDKKLSMKSLGDEDCRNLYRLYDALIENKPVKGLKEEC